MKIFPVIMAGGSGTRFWPLSRRSRPKQFLDLAGEGPLLAATVRRLPPPARPADTLVVCGPAHAAAARRLVKELPAATDDHRVAVPTGAGSRRSEVEPSPSCPLPPAPQR